MALIDRLKAIGDAIREKNGTTELVPLADMPQVISDLSVGVGESVIIESTDGTELVGVTVEEETVLTATANDIRAGKIAATEDGIVEGTKDIPAYRTTAGTRLVLAGSEFSIPLKLYDQYDFTKIQCVIVLQNTKPSDSFATEKVVIEDGVYQVGSIDKIATLTKNADTKSIDLNITNNTEQKYYIRYFTYREEE